MRLIDADAYAAEMAKRQDACGKWMDSAIDELTLQRAEGAYTMLCEAKLTLDEMPTIPAPRWVRCEDELPKRGRLVLAYRGPIAMISAMYTDGCGWRDADLFPMQGVTHWMPLPEPPQEENK